MTAAPVEPDARATEALEAAIGHHFEDRNLLTQALSHRSWCAEHPGTVSNERLEFLGDSVLGQVVTRFAFDRYSQLSEGELSKVRAAVVNTSALADYARGIELGEFLLLGKGEEASGGRTKESILADSMEAVIAAVYLDGGFGAARDLVLALIGDRIDTEALGPGGGNHKERLQELAAGRFDKSPRYRVSDDGPDHDKWFRAVVLLDGDEWGTGEGRTKKEAEQEAARVAWLALLDEAETRAPE